LLTLENVVVKYAPELPAVLQGISFSLKAGERVGLVGRTGGIFCFGRLYSAYLGL
jgi:ABC-type multidrug transport system fused ATPase/permease subunit